MLFLTLSLLFAVAGMLSADPKNKLEACMKGVDMEQLEGLIQNPGTNELDIICPQLLPALKCVDDVLEEELGLRMADMARMIPDEEMGKAAALFLNIQSLLEEVCDSDSDLHKTYNRHSDCLQGIPNSKVEDCLQEARSSYTAYRAFQNKIEDESGKLSKNNDHCLANALASACVAAEIHDTCGVEAFQTYQTIVKRTNVFRLALCSQADLDELKTGFLDSLKLEDERKDLFRLAFDLRKRRK